MVMVTFVTNNVDCGYNDHSDKSPSVTGAAARSMVELSTPISCQSSCRRHWADEMTRSSPDGTCSLLSAQIISTSRQHIMSATEARHTTECYVQLSVVFQVLKLEFRALTEQAGNIEYTHFLILEIRVLILETRDSNFSNPPYCHRTCF